MIRSNIEPEIMYDYELSDMGQGSPTFLLFTQKRFVCEPALIFFFFYLDLKDYGSLFSQPIHYKTCSL